MDARQCTSVPSKCVSDAARVVLSSAETKGSLQVAMERIMKNTIWSQSASLPLVHWHKRPQKQTQSPERMHSPRATAASGAKPLSAEGKFSINPNPHHSGLRILVLVSNSILYGFILIEVLFELNRICGLKINFVFGNLNLFTFILEWQTNAFFSPLAHCALVYYTG